MEKLKFGFINLGCDKNRIDGEIALASLSKSYEIAINPEEADIIIVNTCGFIESSKQESIDTILEMASYKQKKCKILLATGCLTQRYGKELLELMPELDGILGVNDYKHLDEIIEKALNKEKVYLCNYSDSNINEGERIITTKSGTAYIRISEGCDNVCSYCAIPKIRGKYRSRTMENILKEAENLAKSGVHELILVAQDTTRYGVDIYKEKKLPVLLRKLSEIEGIEWIRILYCYAEEITDELIEEIKVNKKVCKYLDIPIQHISDNILKAMRRKGRKKIIKDNINKLRKNIPDIILRTSLIVGFPGETEQDFSELKEFVEEIMFDKLGVFKYSREEDTAAYHMENQISEEMKEIREAEIMLIQQNISKKINENKLGKVYNVIVERFNGESYYGRTYEMAPEIDGEIIFQSNKNLNLGEFVKVEITEALEYDLIGVVLNESSK
ncbi:30S ribosomal protein S12 methylthiotransferase RimO [Hathewaya histolytica]|uniref:Ribosomal protein uS12 methylthiotransferase RimO n=1 Tax=Hathewaya histolytica TaxID=1498 RepID=A0A4U9RCN4_HATHI|nr:30S ribosomal protein S12 methylthiotransferase RimO [Hathewaya histolytica]VTQ89474.1 MiaB-like tRNA modifying enzyme YliG [Hathewaya histolytica]